MDKTLDHIVAQQHDEFLVLEISAPDLNNFGIAQLTAIEIESAITQSTFKKAIISWKNVKFVTSVGLSLVARLTTFAKNTGTQIILCDAASNVALTLKVTKMVKYESGVFDQRLLVVDNLDTAMAALR